mgnify:FL=1
MLKKITFTFLLMSILSTNLKSDGHEVAMDSDGTIAEFNYLTVTDPSNFMMALDRFDKSKCAQKWRDESNVNVSLWSLRGTGSSHFILVVYENADMMQKGRNIFNSCKESADMIKTFQKNTDTDRSWNWISQNVVTGRSWTNNSVFAKYNFNVEEGHEGHYLKAWKKMMKSQMDTITQSFGLNRVVFGNRYVTHMVYVGHDSLDSLLKSQETVLSSDEFAEFYEDVKDIRTNVNTELVQLVKYYTGE